MCAARYHRTHTSVGHIHLSLRRQTDTSRHFIPRPHRHRTVSVKCVGIEHTHARHTTCEQLPRSSSGSAGGCSADGNSPVGRSRRRRRGAANGEGGDEGGDGGEGGEQAARHCAHAESSELPPCTATVDRCTTWHSALEKPVASCHASRVETGNHNKHFPRQPADRRLPRTCTHPIKA